MFSVEGDPMRALVLCIVTTIILGLGVGYALAAKTSAQNNGKKDDIVHGFDTARFHPLRQTT